MAKTLVINGFDFEPFIMEKGLKWKRNDVDTAEAGEMADGTMRRDRMIIRPEMEVTIANAKVFIDDEIGHRMLRALEPQWLDVTYYDLREGQEVSRQFYTNNVEITLWKIQDGRRRWFVESFPLIARGVPGDGRGYYG